MSAPEGNNDRIPPDFAAALQRRGFRVETVIGQGASGTVFRAVQESLGRAVAVKLFGGLQALSAEHRKRFEREAPILARLSNPHIPYVLTPGVADIDGRRVPYHIMQFVSGSPLSSRVGDGRKLPAQEALPVARDVLAALAHAHAQGVVHRDIAPDNILVGQDGAYLIDFSVGFVRDYSPGLTRATVAGAGIGRYHYAAPEQRVDAANVTSRADLYSVGVVLFEMLTGYPNRLPAIDQDLGDMPEVREAIRKACAEDPAQRFSSALEFADALGPQGWVPTPAAWSEVALCSNVTCQGAVWKEWVLQGPRVVRQTAETHCARCGGRLLKDCRKCKRPLTETDGANLDAIVREKYVYAAHCGGCGEVLFKLPTCSRCGRMLHISEVTADTSAGCRKCNAAEEEIPF